MTSTAEQAQDSTAAQALARLGLASRGVVWLVLSVLAGSIVIGRDQQADQGGALRAIADKPFGELLLVVLVVGFLGYSAWLLLTAAVGHRDEDGARRWAERTVSGAKGLLYLALAASTGQFLLNGGGQDQTASRTADLMSKAGGRTAVALIGVVLIVIGLVHAIRGLLRKHSDDLEHYRVPDRLRTPAVVVGAVGLVGRGAVLALVGGFLLKAAATFDPEQAKGLDAALQSLVEQTYGQALLGAAVVGMLAYALWSFVEAAYREL